MKFQVPASFIEKVLTRAIRKRYDVPLETFLHVAATGKADLVYPGCSDLVELSKYL